MLKLKFRSTDLLRAITCAPGVRYLVYGLALSMLFGVDIAVAAQCGARENLAAIVKWSQKAGRRAALMGRYAKSLGLGNGRDVPVRQQSYIDYRRHVVYAVDVTLDSSSQLIFFRNSDDFSIAWRCDLAGELIATIEVTSRPGTDEFQIQSPNDVIKYQPFLQETLKFLLRRELLWAREQLP
jgi:hypothetical protein